ncbi:MAG: sigma-54-dependent Fis family transcriptional regulator [Bdellovibrionaceae bacterium]|nr:sigma-54-dependent Fis family transcriptional regulator [Pseudobdellovibrionaceae bacterium]
MNQEGLKGIQFHSERMRQITNLVNSLIPLESSLNISGPSGSGKTSWANYIIEQSQLQDRILRLDIKEIDEENFKSYLEKNKFRHLLLENIEYLHKENQAVLAQYLQKNAIISKSVVISTSVRGLAELAQQGLLRQDLYYKLTVFRVELPSLKDITDEIPVVAESYMRSFCVAYKKEKLKLSSEAMAKLQMYFWPGNFSELESVLERAVILASDETVQDKHIRFDEFQKHTTLDLSLGMSLSEVERRLILQTLEHTENNRTKAAHILGISIRTLRNKLNEYKEAGLI